MNTDSGKTVKVFMIGQNMQVPEQINDTWSMDFMHDQLKDGRSFRTFNVIDDYNLECPGKGKGKGTGYNMTIYPAG